MHATSLLLLATLCSATAFAAEPAAWTVTSPDNKLALTFTPGEDHRLSYTFRADGHDLIAKSRVGYETAGVTEKSRRAIDSVWKPLWGKRGVVPERFREVVLDCRSYQLEARAYNDGVAFRYVGGSGPEGTDFQFAGDYTAWFYNGENPNLGPEKLSASHGKRLPVMTVKVADDCHLAIHEADLTTGEPMVLESQQGETKFRLCSKPNPAWKVILFGREPGAMVDSHLIELLNPPPPQDRDFSWVKPGVAVWDWRINGAQLDGHHVFGPNEFVTKVFVNMLAGPLDMNNGLADLTQAGRVDHGVPVPSTLAGEAARTLIVFSGATIIPDIPENYRKHPEILQFLAAERQPWRESKTLSGRIGEHIVMARQAADGNWLVGAATNEEARELDVSLTFLGQGNFEATVIEDGDDSDFRTHKESYKAAKRTVTNKDTLHLKLAPGGGACVLLTAPVNHRAN